MNEFVAKVYYAIKLLIWFLFVGLPKKTLGKIKSLFHRDASISIQYVEKDLFDQVGNEFVVKVPDTFKINIDTGKKRRTLWLAADFEDAKVLLDLLDDETNTGVDLQVGDAISSSIYIPRWAKKCLANQLRPHIKYYTELTKPYEIRGEA